MRPQNGNSRFACECGRKFSEPTSAFQSALRHSMEGHHVVFEVYAMGRWRNSGQTVGDLILEGKRARGEDIPTFVSALHQAYETNRITEFVMDAARRN